MKRLLLAICTLASVPGAAMAHSYPAQRSILVQTEPNRAGVMITWQSDVGPRADSFAITSMWPALDRVERLQLGTVRRALSGVDVRLNGAPVDVGQMKVKLISQPGQGAQRRRYGVVVLLEIPTAAGDEMTVSVTESAKQTRLRWLAKGAGSCESCRLDWMRAPGTKLFRW